MLEILKWIMENDIKTLEQELVHVDTSSFLPSKIDEMDSIEDLERVISELEDERFIVSSAEKKNAYWAMPLLVLYFLLIIRGNSQIEDAISSRQRVDEIKEKQLSVREKIFELRVRDEFRETPIQNYMTKLWSYGKSNRSRSDHSVNRDNLLIAYPLFQEYLKLYYNKVPQSLEWDDFEYIYNDFKTFLKTNFPDVFRHGIEIEKAEQRAQAEKEEMDKQKKETEKQEKETIRQAKLDQIIQDMREHFKVASILREIDTVQGRIRDKDYEFMMQAYPFAKELYTYSFISKDGPEFSSVLTFYVSFLKKNFEDLIYEAKSVLLLEHENAMSCGQDIVDIIDRISSKFSRYKIINKKEEGPQLNVFAYEELFIKYLEAYHPGTLMVAYCQVEEYEDYLKKIPEQRKKFKLLESE